MSSSTSAPSASIMRWSNFFHIYQPPGWNEVIIRRVADEAYRPLTRFLLAHPAIRITLNITGALTEQLISLGLDDILLDLRQLLKRGQVELVGSAMYHPILPLLPDQEIRRQIELQDELHRRTFGSDYHPRGFFAPEMAFSEALGKILGDRGYEWVLVDELAVGGEIGLTRFDQRYRTSDGLFIVPRHRPLSDFLSFKAQLDQPEALWAAIEEDVRHGQPLITAMDGENLGHHRPGADTLWQAIITRPEVSTGTISEYLTDTPAVTSLRPVASSWSSQAGELRANIPFGLWHHPDNPIHRLQWELTRVVIDAVHETLDDPNYNAARLLLDRALTSDKYWWASASPWWDVPIILRETQRLTDVIGPLTTVSSKAQRRATQLLEQITTTVELWETSGLARRRQHGYLQTTGDVHYMGGHQVS